MSEKNRRFMYDKLIYEGRKEDICESLLKEFGEVKKSRAPKKAVVPEITAPIDAPADPYVEPKEEDRVAE